MKNSPIRALSFAATWIGLLACSSAGTRYQDATMDFGSIKAVAILPFANLTQNSAAGERVRDVFGNMLLATGAVYVLPQGEVARAIVRLNLATPTTPSVEEVTKLGSLLKVDAVISGVVKEYGEVRSGSSSANVVSASVTLYETATGKIVWSASSTRGGVGFWDRMFGGGGAPVNNVTEQVGDDLINKLFK